MKVLWFTAAMAFAAPALAASATVTSTSVTSTAQIKITINSVPLINFNPVNPSEPCTAPAGTVVAAVSVTGGTSAPIVLGMTDPGGSFVLSGTTPPANILVGPNGISANLCPAGGAPPIVDTATVTATQ